MSILESLSVIFLNLSSLELLQMAINMHHNSPLGANKADSSGRQTEEASRGSEVLERKSEKVKLDKSNILMLGPTGSGLLPLFLSLHFRLFLLLFLSNP